MVSPRYPNTPSNPFTRRSSGQGLGFALAVLGFLATIVLAAGASTPQAGGASAQPNFVVIMSDDQTVGEMSAMRQTRAKIAAKGVTSIDSSPPTPSAAPPARRS